MNSSILIKSFIDPYDRTENNIDVDKRTRKITHRLTELYNSIRENQSDR